MLVEKRLGSERAVQGWFAQAEVLLSKDVAGLRVYCLLSDDLTYTLTRKHDSINYTCHQRGSSIPQAIPLHPAEVERLVIPQTKLRPIIAELVIAPEALPQ